MANSELSCLPLLPTAEAGLPGVADLAKESVVEMKGEFLVGKGAGR